MNRTHSSAVALVVVSVALAGCQSVSNLPVAQYAQRPDGQFVSTTLDQKLHIKRVAEPAQEYDVLVGAFGTEGGRLGRAIIENYDGAPVETVEAPKPTTKSDGLLTGNAAGDAAAVQVISGWIYIVTPPRWPLIRTPRTRGGIRLTGMNAPVTSMVVGYVDGVTERVFYLNSVDAAGVNVPSAMFTLEAVNPPYSPTPSSVTLSAGQYAEITMDPVTLRWSNISVKSISRDSAVANELLRYIRTRAGAAAMPWNPAGPMPQ